MDSNSKWRSRVEDMLEVKGVKEVLTNLDHRSPTFLEKDALARAIVLECIPGNYHEYVRGKKTAKEMVDEIESALQRKKLWKKMFHLKRLVLLKYKETESLQSHFATFESIIREVDESSGHKFDEDEKVCFLLLTLPVSYGEVINNMKKITSGFVTLPFVKETLIDFAAKRNSALNGNPVKVEEQSNDASSEGGGALYEPSLLNVEVKVEYLDDGREELCDFSLNDPNLDEKPWIGWLGDVHQSFIEGVQLENEPRTKPYPCNMCPKEYKTRLGLRKHTRKNHHPDGKKPKKEVQLICDFCGDVINSKIRLVHHLRKHLNYAKPDRLGKYDRVKSEKIHDCPICGKIMASYTSLWQHKKRHLAEVEAEDVSAILKKPRQRGNKDQRCLCDVCGKSFRSAVNLALHKRIHSGVFRYKCEFCDKGFHQKTQMKVHVRMHTGERPYTCETCGKAFAGLAGLNTHRKTHLGLRPHKCTICGKGWQEARDLTIHMRSHTKEKPFLCNICGKGFSVKGPLNVHMRLHQPINCSLCNETVLGKSLLKSHLKIAHNGMKIRPECFLCGMSFARPVNLTNHMRIHAGSTPKVPCTVCGKLYSNKPNLDIHMSLHTGEGLLACEICSKTFVRKQRLQEHVNECHVLGKPCKPKKYKNPVIRLPPSIINPGSPEPLSADMSISSHE